MKILLLSTCDITGGAARAAFRLHYGLRHIGLQSQMLVQDKKSDGRHVIGPIPIFSKSLGKIRPYLDRLPLKLYPNRKATIFSVEWIPDSILSYIDKINPDVIHLHWICGGFIPIRYLRKIKKPIVWTLHDMWAITGGCHYAGNCERYKESCGRCPQLGSKREKDLSR